MKNIPCFSARNLIGSCLYLLASLASAAVYFTPDGAGAGNGSDWTNAYPATQLQTQADALPVGETLYLGSGTYTLVNLIITTSGEAGAPKRLVGVDTGGGLPLFQGTYAVASGAGGAFFRFPGAAHFWEIKNLRFNNYRYGLDMSLVGTTFDLRSDLLFENLAFDSVEDGVRIRNATGITVKNCSVIRHTKKAFRIGLYTDFLTYDGCSTDCTGGDASFPSQSIPVGFGCDDTNDAPLIHDITFLDCSARHNGFAQPDDDYWNGDGYSSERGTYNLTFIRCASYDNNDGGFDNKANNVTFQDCIAIGNKIGYRHWGTGGVYENCIGAYNKKHGGTSSSEGLWIATSAQVTVNFSTFHGNDSAQVSIDGAGVVELVDSVLSTPSTTAAFVAGTGATLTRSATFRPGEGTDPLFVADSALWRGTPVDALDSVAYGSSKGYNSGRVGASANLPPTLTANATPNSGMPPLTVQFSATADDADGVVVAYFWDFGDGVTSFERDPPHVYSAPGSFVARCMIRDNRGAEASQTFPIEVALPTTPVPLRIEAGSAAGFTDAMGQTWVADHSFGAGGGTVDRGAIEIANTVDDRLYQTERWGVSGYAILLANGTYTVKLHFAETYAGITAAGQRIFSVSAEGAVPAAWNQIDIFAEAGGRNTALVKSATVRVTDQVLNLGFIASIENTLVDAIEIIPATNEGPDLAISASSMNGATPFTVGFTATATDADGAVAGYHWDFGDGTSSTEQNPSHTYITAGNFTATCAATDNEGAYSAKSLSIIAAGPAPTGLTATHGTTSDITLTWNANGGASSYRVKRAGTSGGPYELIATVATTSFRDAGLIAGQTYYYVVSSLNGVDESANSNEASAAARNAVTTVDDADATGVTITGEWTTATTTSGYYGTGYKADLNTGTTVAKSVRFTPALLNSGDYQVSMRWTAGTNRGSNVPVDIIHAGGTTTVSVNQRLTGNQWMPLGTFHFDAGVAGSVLLRNNGANGFVIADAVQFVELEAAPPAAPTDLVATGGLGQISLAWTASIGATSYNVKRATSAGGPFTSVANAVTAASYVDATATGGMTYYYVVSAQNGYGESPASISATAASQLGSVIVDNTDATTVIVGDWIPATTASGYYGANYIQDNNTGATGGKSVTYIPALTGGTYVVSLRWTSNSNRASNVPVEIQSLTGVSMVNVNEKTGGGVWNPIGTFDFAPGTASRVVIKNNGTNGYVIADAVQFSQVALPAANAPVITSASTAAGVYGQPFEYAITADNGASVYSVTGLPAGLAFNSTTGVISGSPATVGSFAIGLSAANTAGTDTASLALQIASAPQSISFPGPGPRTFGDGNFVLSATTSSGLPVSYSVISGPALVNGSTVTLTGAGTVEIAAAQAGDDNYEAAPSVRVTFTVAPALGIITLADLAQTYDGLPRAVTAVTTPAGLAVRVTYDGAETPPVYPGTYAVVATSADADFSGSVSGTLVISASVSVRHAPAINGLLDGSVQVLLPESFALNSNAAISGDLLVPGTPIVRQNGHPLWAGVIDSGPTGSSNGTTITLNSGAVLRYLVRQIAPVELAAISAPHTPAGTQSIAINSPSQTVADFSVVRNLTLNNSAASVAVPPGAYGTLTANGNSRFIFGLAGAIEPSIYDLQQLQLNGSARIELAGPVIIRVAGSTSVNGSINLSGDPSDLILEIASGGLTLNSSAVVNGSVFAPQGTVTVNSSGVLCGKWIEADRLVINGSGQLLTEME